MTDAVAVRLLADAPEVISTLAAWYKLAWPDWFSGTSLAEIESDFRSVANRDRLPLAVVALNDFAEPLGVCSLRGDPFMAYPSAGPWLRGLYVHEPFRGQGVAGMLIRAAEQHASRLELRKLYASTHEAIGTFERAGWLGFDQVQHDGQALTIFARRLGAS